jgi:hypothetical protein
MRVVRALSAATVLILAGAVFETPLNDAFAQSGVKQGRAKKAKTAPRRPAARTSMQPAPAAVPASPAYDPSTRGSGGGY